MKKWSAWAHQARSIIARRDETGKAVKQRSKVYVGLIDVIFGIVIALSFQGIPAAIHSWWSFSAVSLAVAYGMVVTSWVSYHASIRKQPHKTWFRFVLDLFLVFDYFVMVNYSSVPKVVFAAYFAMFLLYVLWDALKWVEYPAEVGLKALVRCLYPLSALSILWAVWATGNWNSPGPTWESQASLLVLLLFIVALRVLFRLKPLDKYVPVSAQAQAEIALAGLKARYSVSPAPELPDSQWY